MHHRPVSSWAAAVGSTLYETGAFPNEMAAFLATIPYNMYAILSILIVLVLSFSDLEFGPHGGRGIQSGDHR